MTVRLPLLLCLLVCSSVLAGCLNDDDAPDPLRMSVAAYEGEAAMLVWYADHIGAFESVGLEVELTGHPSGRLATADLTAGAVEVATAGDAAFVAGLLRGDELSTFGSISRYLPYWLVTWKEENISSFADLAGKEVALTLGTSAAYAFAWALEAANLTFEDVTLHDLPTTDLSTAFENGSVSAAWTWQPNTHLMRSAVGFENTTAIRPATLPRGHFVLLAAPDWVSANGPAAERLLEALQKAEVAWDADPATARSWMEDRFNLSTNYVDEVWDDTQLRLELPQSALSRWEDIAQWRLDNNLSTPQPVPDMLNAVDPAPLEAVWPARMTMVTD